MQVPPLRYAKTSDGVNIAYFDVGDGPPVVFASGIYGDAYLYRRGFPSVTRFVDVILGAGWRVVLYDIRGMGASDKPVERLDLDARVKDLEAVVGALGLSRFALAALDLGCVTAIAYAASHGDGVSRLILLEPWASGARKYAVTPTRVAHSMNPASGDDWTIWANVLGSLVTGFRDRDLAQQLADAIMESTSPSQLATYFRSTGQIDVVDLLPKVAVPALVTHATDSVVGSQELAREVASGLSNARFLVSDWSETWPAVKAFLLDDDEARPALSAPQIVNASALSRRQAEVLRLIALGRTNREIADDLVLSLRTVERHVADLYDKLGVRNRAEAVAIGLGIDSTAKG
jgi:pimeloyl-ACP methyl ester carboxylesterase